MSNELIVMNDNIDDNLIKRLDYSEDELAELTEEQKQKLVEMYQDEINETSHGVDLKPVKVKINKDMQKFMDPFDNVLESLEGVIVYKHKARGFWPEGSGKVPECSSKDGLTGIINETGDKRKCAGCPYNQWGSAKSDDGEETSGKACKEMRRLFIDLDDYELPVMLTLPPTSIKAFDKYISARMTKGIPDIFKETIITLREEESHGYTYAVAKFMIGENVKPDKIMKLKKNRKIIKETAAEEDIMQEDYGDIENEEDDINMDDIA